MRYRTKQGLTVAAVCAALLVAVLTPAAWGYITAPRLSQAEINQLTQLTQQYLQERANTQVNGIKNRNKNLTSLPMTPELQKKFQAEAVRLEKWRQDSEARDGGYSKARVVVALKKIEGTTTRPVLTVNDYTTLYRSTAQGLMIYPKGGLNASEYSIDRTVVFVKTASGWQLESDTPQFGPPGSARGLETWAPEPERPQQGSRDNSWVMVPGMQGIPGSQLQQSLKQGRSARTSKLSGFTAQSYNYQAMWNYAERYWQPYNPSYHAYSNDCTNFISQIVAAGGWPEVGTWAWEREDPSKWFYGDYTWTTSYTWAASHNWAEFAVNYSHRTTLIPPWQVLPTDIVQVDWTKADGSPSNSEGLSVLSPYYSLSLG